MPNKQSAVKALRQSQKRALRNNQKLSEIKDLSRHFKKAISAQENDKAIEISKKIITALDKASQKKIIHNNTASRTIARLTKKVNSIK